MHFLGINLKETLPDLDCFVCLIVWIPLNFLDLFNDLDGVCVVFRLVNYPERLACVVVVEEPLKVEVDKISLIQLKGHEAVEDRNVIFEYIFLLRLVGLLLALVPSQAKQQHC